MTPTDIATIGQYLRPTARHLPVVRWWEPERTAQRCRNCWTDRPAVAFSHALHQWHGEPLRIITGDVLGMPILVQDAASAGDWTSITHTTTAAAYTVLVPRARWDEPCEPEAVAPIFLNT